MKYILPLSPDYISEWTEWHATRELLQNAMDAQDAGGEKPIMKYSNKVLTIESPKERLSRKSLLLGSTTKSNAKNQRGQFGEGYKLALLVFCRKLYDVKILNGGETWIPKFEPHADYENASVLTIDISPSVETYDGIRFIIKGFPQEAWDLVKTRWLPDALNDTILPVEQAGNIYSGGLFITQSKKLLRGYNFAPHRLNLGRDRDVVGDFDVCCHTSSLWSTSNNTSDLMALLKTSAADVEYVSYIPPSSAAVIVKKFEKEYGPGTVPVRDQKELDAVRSAGFNAQIVSDGLRKIVNSVKKFVYHELRTPGGKIKQFFDKYSSRLDLDIREELAILVSESAGWRS